jgi:hypothetical protein
MLTTYLYLEMNSIVLISAFRTLKRVQPTPFKSTATDQGNYRLKLQVVQSLYI